MLHHKITKPHKIHTNASPHKMLPVQNLGMTLNEKLNFESHLKGKCLRFNKESINHLLDLVLIMEILHMTNLKMTVFVKN